MKNSSAAEKVIAGLVTVLIGVMGFVAVMTVNLNREQGVANALLQNLHGDVDQLQDRLREHEIGHD